MAEIRILEVVDKSLRKQFVAVPWTVFPHECNYVPQLKMDFARLIDPKRHPFWEFSEQSLYLAFRDDRPIGRIAAIIDNRYNDYHNEKMGIWGFFDCLDDQEAANALFRAAEKWIRSHGMEFVRGPLNPSTNYEVGLLIDGFENFPALMMPWNFPYYLKLVEANGYIKEKDLLSMRLNKTDPLSPKIERLAQRVRRKTSVTIRPLSTRNFLADVRLLVEIYHDAWSENWGFVPMSESEIKEMAKNLKRGMEAEMIFFIYYENEPVGVGLVLPDYNPLLKQFNGRITISGITKYLFRRKYVRGGRAFMGGIKKQVRNLGLPVIIFDYLNQLLRTDDRIDYLEMGWNLEDNDAINKFELAMGAHIRSRYRIFRKNLY